jgi:hypothetical protein
MMKRFVVEQTGMVQLEATRRFVVEVPDHFTEDQTEDLLQHTSLPDEEYEEDMAWSDDLDRLWIGYDVEIDSTDIYDPDNVAGAPATDGLKVITLGEAK